MNPPAGIDEHGGVGECFGEEGLVKGREDAGEHGCVGAVVTVDVVEYGIDLTSLVGTAALPRETVVGQVVAGPVGDLPIVEWEASLDGHLGPRGAVVAGQDIVRHVVVLCKEREKRLRFRGSIIHRHRSRVRHTLESDTNILIPGHIIPGRMYNQLGRCNGGPPDAFRYTSPSAIAGHFRRLKKQRGVWSGLCRTQKMV